MSKKINRIIFIDYLRVIALLTVFYYHIFYIFWQKNDLVVSSGYTIPFKTAINLPYFFINDYLERLNLDFGVFAVSIFFLVAGFTTQLTLTKISRFEYLLKKILRIYPVFIIGLLLVLSFQYLYNLFFHLPFSFPVKEFLVNISLFRDLTSVRILDTSSWFLETLIKYYLLIFVFSFFTNFRKVGTFIFISILFLLNGLVMFLLPYLNFSPDQVGQISSILVWKPVYFILAFLGMAYYNFYKKIWPVKLAPFIIIYFAIPFIITAGAWGYAPQRNQFLVSGVCAFFIFNIFYFVRDKIRPNFIISFLSSISYPFYILHTVTGYLFMSWFVNIYPSPYLAILLSFGLIATLAFFIHLIVERHLNYEF